MATEGGTVAGTTGGTAGEEATRGHVEGDGRGNGAGGIPTPPGTGRATLAALERALDALSPPDGVTIRDAAGREYRLPGAIPAVRQLRALPAVEALLALPTARGAASSAGERYAEGDLAGALVVALGAVLNEDALQHVDAAFAAAYPDALASARASAGLPNAPASELFPVEELVGALLPFCGRLVGRLSTPLLALLA